MAGKKSDLGPTGLSLAENVRRLREDRGLAYAELSRRLGDAGREIPPLGLRRIESGERRVDADDLVALAAALGVSPITLLMPQTDDGEDHVEGTGIEAAVEARRYWRWLQAHAQLSDGKYDEFLTFVARSLPPWRQGEVLLIESGIGPYMTRFVREKAVDDGDD